MNMEIDEINVLERLHRLKNTRAASIKDHPPEEMQKRARFVKMLKEMPEVTSLDFLDHVNKVIAKKIYKNFQANL